MPPEYEPIAEEIIRLFWYNPDHSFNWFVVYKEKLKLPNVRLEDFNRIKPLIKQDLIDEGFIEKVKLTSLDIYKLTKKGREFISFEDERKKEQKAATSKKHREIPQKYWLLIAVFGWVVGIFTPILTDKAKSLFQQQTKKETKEQVKDSAKHDSTSSAK